MTTTPDQKDTILSQLEPFGDFTCRPMMGEYLLYLNGVYIGGIYDGRILLKATLETKSFNLPEILPYASAKRMMYHLDNFDDRERAQAILSATYQALKKPSLRFHHASY